MIRNEKPRKFDFMDLTGKNRTLDCVYKGSTNVHLEGRILRETEENLVIGVSLWPQDVVLAAYNIKEKSFDVYYRAPPADEIRISILKMTEYEVPKSVTSIRVYDADFTMKPLGGK